MYNIYIKKTTDISIKNAITFYKTRRYSNGYNRTLISNVSLREKLIQDLTTEERYQDVNCYNENIDIVVPISGTSATFVNEGVYLPYPNCNIVDRFSLNTNLLTTTVGGKTYTIRK